MSHNLARRLADVNHTREQRRFSPAQHRAFGQIEHRAADGGDRSVTISGYSSVFDSWYSVRDMFGEYKERVDAKAFDKSIAEGRDIRGMFNHSPDFPLGSEAAGTLRTSTDSIGLRYALDLDLRSPAHQTVHVAVERGDVRGASFAFETIRDRWEYDHDTDEEFRTLQELRLFEHGPVTTPASDFTTAYLEASGRSEAADADIRSIALKLRRSAPLNVHDVRLFNAHRSDILDALNDLGSPLPSTTDQPDQLGALAEVVAFEARMVRGLM